LISHASRAANSGAGQLEEIGAMGELTDKIKGNVNEAVGKAKQQSDDPDTRDEGAGQEVKGQAEQLVGSVKGALGDKV
jgi:uncharacterized protein YjbJ (UPF0337 family)